MIPPPATTGRIPRQQGLEQLPLGVGELEPSNHDRCDTPSRLTDPRDTPYYQANKLWSGSYFAGSVGGAPLSVVKQYIEQQNRPG
ncbi:hypothetical protein GCM10009681_10500 [Luedemannella helvata]|uniref:Transposase IS200-like domain-containing protein n=1 Tax=Luedemannella helvata TaxID=349315 RepID=A0ABN2JX16_9ACTN